MLQGDLAANLILERQRNNTLDALVGPSERH